MLNLSHICYTYPMLDEITNEPTIPESEPQSDPILPPVEVPETQTPQIPVNEPLPTPEETKPETETIPEEVKSKEPEKEIPEPEPKEEIKPESRNEKQDEPVSFFSKRKLRELLEIAREKIQFRKRNKLNKIMNMFEKKQKITNDEVEKFLHVSDATAGRYLNILEKEGKIIQNGKTGKSVFYSKI